MGTHSLGQVLVRLLLPLVAALALVFASAGPAGAHAVLLESTPADGESVDGGLGAIVLTFNEPMQQPSSVVVTGPGGDTVADERAEIDGERVVLGLDPLPEEGTYTVTWRAVSADDHPIDGEFTFEVTGVPAAEPGPGAGEVDADDGETAEAPAAGDPAEADRGDDPEHAGDTETPGTEDDPGGADGNQAAATELTAERDSTVGVLLAAAAVAAVLATAGTFWARRRTAGER